MATNSDEGCSKHSRYLWILLVTLVLLLGIVIGIIIGYFVIKHKETQFENDKCSLPVWDNIINKVNRERLRENLRQLASHPHIAGQKRDEELVSLIKSRWENDGLDEVRVYSYEVLLSHPDPNTPNKVHVMDDKNRSIYTTVSLEEELRQGELENLVPAFNAYSPSGNVQGKLVFVNYAQKTDFETLKKMGINVTGLICIARYGKIYRGNQVLNAYEEGAKGIIFYSDPQDVAPLGTEADKVYPNTIFLPPTGIQRGSVYLGSGDPLTPSWPSIEGAYRIQLNKANLPKIPSQPIGYGDARHLLQMLGGKAVPEEWDGRGGLTNISIGPGFHLSAKAKDVLLEVHSSLKLHTAKNVIGKIRGLSEPDRYVIVGNHRDAWGFGAADPTSGTAQLLETVRVLGDLKQQGWRPKRSILFASWGAEEYGIIGSQEWVEEMGTAISAQGVALVNTDTCVSGTDLEISASPLLYNMAVRALTKVMSPNDPATTLYKEWRELKTSNDSIKDWTQISSPGAGTDEAPFSFYVGIPSVDIWFRSSARKKYNISIYPAYHTGYDTLFLMENFIDPSFNIHRACSQLTITMLLELTESHILPFNFHHLVDSINKAYASIKEKETILRNYVQLDHLSAAIDNFTDVAYHWQETLEAETKDKCVSSLKARILNDQMMQVERAFILPEGLPDTPANRHVVFSPSSFDAYEGGGFPGILDLLYKLSNDQLVAESRQELSNLLRKHVSDILVHIVQATHVLQSI